MVPSINNQQDFFLLAFGLLENKLCDQNKFMKLKIFYTYILIFNICRILHIAQYQLFLLTQIRCIFCWLLKLAIWELMKRKEEILLNGP